MRTPFLLRLQIFSLAGALFVTCVHTNSPHAPISGVLGDTFVAYTSFTINNKLTEWNLATTILQKI
jgi:hypothetical protein